MKEPGTVNQGWRSFRRDISKRLPHRRGVILIGVAHNQRQISAQQKE